MFVCETTSFIDNQMYFKSTNDQKYFNRIYNSRGSVAHTFKFFTFFPSLTTTPEDSWPIIIGFRTTKSPILPLTK